MKLYENVINAVFVSFRSKGRGVIRNAFAPRDGGHLLLSLPHLVSPLPHISLLPFSIYLSLPPSLSLSLPLSFFLARQFVRFSPSLFLFSLPVFFLFLFLFFIFLFRSWSPTLLFPVLLSGSQVKRP